MRATVICSLLAPPARADDSATCERHGDRELDQAIAACTRLIKAGTLKGRALAAIYFERGSRYGSDYYRGNIYGGKGELDRAIADYDFALKLDPGSVAALLARGNQFAAKGQIEQFYIDKGEVGRKPCMRAFFDRAIADYDSAIGLDPKSVDLYFYRGLAYAMSGRLAEAIADDTTAIGLDPRRGELYDERGRAYAKQGDLERAIGDFEEALRLDPADVDASGDLAHARAALEHGPAH